MAKLTPDLPDLLQVDRKKLVDAAFTIRSLEEQLDQAKQERDEIASRMGKLEAQVTSLNEMGSLRHIQYLDDALTRERSETVALRAEVLELRDIVQEQAHHRHLQTANGAVPVSAAPVDNHEAAILRSTISDLEERLVRERALAKSAGDMLNREYVANLTASHKREVASLRQALAEAHSQLGDARALIAAHGVARQARSGPSLTKY